MTDVQAPVRYGQATGYFTEFVADTDGGAIPDERELDGFVILLPLTRSTRWPTASPPRLSFPTAVRAPVIDGWLCNPDTFTPGVPLIATDQPDGQPDIVQWQADFHLGIGTSSVVFNVPADSAVDISQIVSQSRQPGTITVVSHEDAQDAAQSAADAAASAEEAANAGYPLTAVYTYVNGDISTTTEDGVLTSYAYNPDGSVHSDTRGSVTRIYSYDGSGNLTGITAA